MPQNFRRGVLTVSTLDRSEDLRRMLTSLWKHNKIQVQVMMAKDWFGAHELKSRMGALSSFDATIFLDTDIYVRGDLTELFKIAEAGLIGIYRHMNLGHWNSGVICFNKDVGAKLSAEWHPRRTSMAAGYCGDLESRSYYRTDQKSLNEIIDRFPIHELSGIYNYMIPERSLEDEARDWEKVKIHHFIHKGCKNRALCRAYKEWMEL